MPALSNLPAGALVAGWPSLNAVLNATCACFLLAGFYSIRRGRIAAHRFWMQGAFAVSVLFLISYLTYHATHGATKFPGTGLGPRTVYLAILFSHTVLAVVIVPLVLRTLYLGRRRRDEAHRRIARWTFPLWLYVSVTGVVVYWMLYRMRWN